VHEVSEAWFQGLCTTDSYPLARYELFPWVDMMTAREGQLSIFAYSIAIVRAMVAGGANVERRVDSGCGEVTVAGPAIMAGDVDMVDMLREVGVPGGGWGRDEAGTVKNDGDGGGAVGGAVRGGGEGPGNLSLATGGRRGLI
jgi:hypothetical protein